MPPPRCSASTELLGRKPRQLSGGQRQRVAMGRAIVREPAVFLMDEPLSNLDAKLRVQMRSEVLRVHRSVGAATLYVTHDQIEAMTMGDRVAVLQGGRAAAVRHAAVAVRPAGEPVRRHVHRLAGDEPLRGGPGSGGSSGSTPAVVLGSQRLALPAQVAARVAAYQGRKVIVGRAPGGSRGWPVRGCRRGAGRRRAPGRGAGQRAARLLLARRHAAGGAAAADESAQAGILAASAPNGVARLDLKNPRSGPGRRPRHLRRRPGAPAFLRP